MQLLLFGFAIQPGPLAAVPLGGLEYCAPLLLGVDCALYACHEGVPILVRAKRSVVRGSQPFSSFLMRFLSFADTSVRPSRRRVRVLGLYSSRCLRLAFSRTIFPVPVRRNRFEAPLWDFALGMSCRVLWFCLFSSAIRLALRGPAAPLEPLLVAPPWRESSRRGAGPAPSSCCGRPAWLTSRRSR